MRLKSVLSIFLFAFAGFINAYAAPMTGGWGCSLENEIKINPGNAEYMEFLPPAYMIAGSNAIYISAAGVRTHFAAEVTRQGELWSTVETNDIVNHTMNPGNDWYRIGTTNGFKKVECGNNFLIALDSNGQIYGLGCDLSNPILGNNPNSNNMTLNELDPNAGGFIDFCITKNKAPLEFGTVFGLTKYGEVFGLGSNSNNIINSGSGYYTTYQLIADGVKAIASGKTFMAYIQNGELKYNGIIQTGIPAATGVTIDISPITGKGGTIASIKALAYTLIIQDNLGCLYYVGYQPGTANQNYSATPQQISDMAFGDFSAGYNHVIALEASTNKVYTFGEDSNDKLGYQKAFVDRPALTLQTVPKEVPNFLYQDRAQRVFAGWNQSYAMGDGSYWWDSFISATICKGGTFSLGDYLPSPYTTDDVEHVEWLSPLAGQKFNDVFDITLDRSCPSGWWDIIVTLKGGNHFRLYIYLAIRNSQISVNGIDLSEGLNMIPYCSGDVTYHDDELGACYPPSYHLCYTGADKKSEWVPDFPYTGPIIGTEYTYTVKNSFGCEEETYSVIFTDNCPSDPCSYLNYVISEGYIPKLISLDEMWANNPNILNTEVELLDEHGARIYGPLKYLPGSVIPGSIALGREIPILPGIHCYTIKVTGKQRVYDKVSKVWKIENYSCGTTVCVGNSEVGTMKFSPNPASDAGQLSFNLDKTQNVSVLLLNADDVRVSTLFEGELQAGENNLNVDLSNVPSGAYKVAVKTASGISTTNIKVVK